MANNKTIATRMSAAARDILDGGEVETYDAPRPLVLSERNNRTTMMIGEQGVYYRIDAPGVVKDSSYNDRHYTSSVTVLARFEAIAVCTLLLDGEDDSPIKAVQLPSGRWLTVDEVADRFVRGTLAGAINLHAINGRPPVYGESRTRVTLTLTDTLLAAIDERAAINDGGNRTAASERMLRAALGLPPLGSDGGEG